MNQPRRERQAQRHFEVAMKVSPFLVKACALFCSFVTALLLLPVPTPTVSAQDTVTGAFEGIVTSSQTGQPITGATALIVNQHVMNVGKTVGVRVR